MCMRIMTAAIGMTRRLTRNGWNLGCSVFALWKLHYKADKGVAPAVNCELGIEGGYRLTSTMKSGTYKNRSSRARLKGKTR